MEQLVGIFSGIIDKLTSLFAYTKIGEQFDKVDYMGLLTNPFFLVPAIIFLLYMLYKQNFRDLIIASVLCGVWYFTGTDYAHSLIVDGKIESGKILPVVGGGAVVLAFLIYLLFGKSD